MILIMFYCSISQLIDGVNTYIENIAPFLIHDLSPSYNKSNTTSDTYGVGPDYPSGAQEFVLLDLQFSL
jgi:hypothetical protein